MSLVQYFEIVLFQKNDDFKKYNIKLGFVKKQNIWLTFIKIVV